MATDTLYHIFGGSGEVFSICCEVTAERVLRSPWIRKDEMRFCEVHLEQTYVDFALNEKCMIFCRTAMHPVIGGQYEGRNRRYVVFLHDFSDLAHLTNSWAFVKFVQPLFTRGFDVVLIDLPGFGKSSVAQNVKCSPDWWRSWDYKLMGSLFETAGISNAHIVAKGETAGLFLKMLRFLAPEVLGRSHILLDPIIPPEDLQSILTVETVKKAFLIKKYPRVWIAHDPQAYGSFPREKSIYRMIPTLKLFSEILRTSPILADQIMVTEYDKSDLTPVQLVPKLGPGLTPIFCLHPSLYFKTYVVEWISAVQALPTFVPGSLRYPEFTPRDDVVETIEEKEEKCKAEELSRKLNWSASSSPSLLARNTAEKERDARTLRALVIQAKINNKKKKEEAGANDHLKDRHAEIPNETGRQKFLRLLKWKDLPPDPESYGKRLKRFNYEKEVDAIMEESRIEYEEEYNSELLAIEESKRTFEEEETDERLKALRNRDPDEEKLMIKKWQEAAEESLKLEMLRQLDDDGLMKKAIKESMRGTTLSDEDLLTKVFRDSEETYAMETVARSE